MAIQFGRRCRRRRPARWIAGSASSAGLEIVVSLPLEAQLSDGQFAVNTSGRIPDVGELGEKRTSVLTLSFRDTCNMEQMVLAAALRWAADQIDPPRGKHELVGDED